MAGADFGRRTPNFLRLAATLRSRRLPCALMLPGCQGIDYSAPARHPRSFTVDHILPRDLYPHLAEDPRNLQPACWHCNASKGTGPGRPALPDLGEPSEAF